MTDINAQILACSKVKRSSSLRRLGERTTYKSDEDANRYGEQLDCPLISRHTECPYPPDEEKLDKESS